MSDYYIDTGGSGTDPYDTWAKAANTPALAQDVLDTVVAGETIHAQGSLTLTAQLDIDTNEGNTTDGFIKLIGYNGSEVNDGTRFVIDGDNAAVNILMNASMDYWWFENIEVKNSNGGDGFEASGPANKNVFVNCCANNNDVYGFSTYNFNEGKFIRCVSYSNTNDGFGNGRSTQAYLFCRSHDNGGSGFDLYYVTGYLFGCIANNNTNDGFDNVRPDLINCVSDNNTDNGYQAHVSTYMPSLIGCRITNHDGSGDIGVNAGGQFLLSGWNYYQNNDGANIQNDGLVMEIPYNGSGTDVEDQGDTESGYVDEDDPEDYNLTDVATSRRTAIQIPVN